MPARCNPTEEKELPIHNEVAMANGSAAGVMPSHTSWLPFMIEAPAEPDVISETSKNDHR